MPKLTIREVGGEHRGLALAGLWRRMHLPQLLAPFTASFACAPGDERRGPRGKKGDRHHFLAAFREFWNWNGAREAAQVMVLFLLAPGWHAVYNAAWMFLPYLVLEQGSPATFFGAGRHHRRDDRGCALRLLVAARGSAVREPRRWAFQTLLAAAGSCGGLAVFFATFDPNDLSFRAKMVSDGAPTLAVRIKE